MKILSYIAMVLLPALAFGFTEITIAPKDRIRLSALSDHILLIDASRVEWKPATVEGGMEFHELVISGTVVEVLRGKSRGKDFTYTCKDFRVADEDAYKKANGGSSSPDMLHSAPTSQKTGAAEVKVGLRYLAIYFHESVFFVQVTADDKTWRGKILEFQKDNPRASKEVQTEEAPDKPVRSPDK